MPTYATTCHCGDLKVSLWTDLTPATLPYRTCTCSFCRLQAAAYTSDPSGQAEFTIGPSAQVVRYRFATATADFLSCGRCSVYLGATFQAEGRDFAVLNAVVLPIDFGREPKPMSFAEEAADTRLARRQRTWTPTQITHL